MKRKIVIVGHWFCGSTLLSGLMNNVPGVASPGELQWLRDDPETSCWACGSRQSCDLIAGVCRPGLSDANLYDRAAEALGCEVLVTSDKMPGTIQRFITRGGADGVLVFKRPEAFEASFKRHGSGDTASSAFTRFYPDALDWCRRRLDDLAVVEYEELASDPERTMVELCKWLGLEAPDELEHPPRSWHNIRGNMEALGSERYRDRPILPDDRWRFELSRGEIDRIRADRSIQTVWRNLQAMAA